MSTEETDRRVRGKVKWFDPGKGFGFVVVECEERDILLHANVLRNYGQKPVADGATVDISIQKTPRGYQAVTVHAIEPPKDTSAVPLADIEEMDPEVLHAAELEPGRVKWFDKNKGFGFANVFSRCRGCVHPHRSAAPLRSGRSAAR